MRIVTLLWLVFVVGISMMPLKFKYKAGTTGALHDPGHFVVFLVTAMLVCSSSPNLSSKLLRWFGICYFALTLEVLEWILYLNRMEWKDVLLDIAGAATGLALLSVIPRISAGFRRTEI